MSQGQHSEYEIPEGVGLTALIIAQARAVESQRPDRLFDDPFAEEFVAAAGPAFSTTSEEIASRLTFQGDYVALRTRFFDDCLLDACQAGCRQVVLLGAGLDTRAFRLSWPEGVRLFELDLPEVLSFKEGVLATRSATPTCRRVAVGVDLREDWARALVAAGFLAEEPTAWLVEGILMYLTENERNRLLDRVGELSAPGSRLALEQRGAGDRERRVLPADPPEPDGSEGSIEQAKKASEELVARLGVQMNIGQPDFSMMDPENWLTRHGWRSRMYSAAERFLFYGRPVPPPMETGAVQLWLASAERS